MMDNIRPILTEADYDWALAEVEPYFANEPEFGTAESNRFLVLIDLITAYEAKAHPIAEADPIDAIIFAMEQTGRTQKDLAALLGSKSRASEILSRRRSLTKEAIYRISKEWRIPADVLIVPYHLKEAV